MKNAVALSAFAAAFQAYAVNGELVQRQSSSGSLVINTPTQLVTCEVTKISFTGGTAPYFVSVFPGGTQANPIIQFPAIQASPLSWTVNLTVGTTVSLGITDGAGDSNAAQQVTVTAGPDTSCVGTSTNTSSPSGGSSGSSGSSSTGSGSGSSATTKSSGGSSTAGSSTTASSPASTTGGSSGSGSGAGMIKAGASTLALGALAAVAYLF